MEVYDPKAKSWKEDANQLYSRLETTSSGLSTKEALKRIRKFGANEISNEKKLSAIRIFLTQFENWLMLILIAAAFTAFFLGSRIESLVIISLVFLSGFFGFIQEFKAEKTLRSLKKYITNITRVLRDGRWAEIISRKIVVGDIVELHIGDKVPADIRLTSVDHFSTDESVLTGESMPVEKNTDVLNTLFRPKSQTSRSWEQL
jgi:Ca2+-transporting ATPase